MTENQIDTSGIQPDSQVEAGCEIEIKLKPGLKAYLMPELGRLHPPY